MVNNVLRCAMTDCEGNTWRGMKWCRIVAWLQRVNRAVRAGLDRPQ